MTDQAMPTSQQAPELINIEQECMGGHAAHWQLLSDQPDQDVPQWLQQALNNAHIPYGLNTSNQDLPQDSWLINGPDQDLQITQLIELDAAQQPVRLMSAFPIINSPYTVQGTISRIMCCRNIMQAVLNITTTDGATIYAFDNLFSINQHRYKRDQVYQICLGGFAYNLEKVKADETLTVDDPAAIKHHRALNDILVKNKGIAPEDLQAQIEAWHPASADDEAPVTLDLSKMVAYLYGDHLGQEDEAWFQGEIVGLSHTVFMDKTVDLIDASIIREQDSKPVIIRLAYINNDKNSSDFQVGDYIRGNIWIQATIYATNNN
jgi:hypothetical protein